jgi:hypothetical protein
MNEAQLTPDARTQLRDVIIQPYEEFLPDLYKIANNSDMNRIWITPFVSQAILDRIPAYKRLIAGTWSSQAPQQFLYIPNTFCLVFV